MKWVGAVLHRIDHCEKAPYIERLGDVVVRTGCEEQRGPGGCRVRTEHDDRRLSRARIGSQGSEQVFPRHVWEMQIQQDQIGSVLQGQLEA